MTLGNLTKMCSEKPLNTKFLGYVKWAIKGIAGRFEKISSGIYNKYIDIYYVVFLSLYATIIYKINKI